MGEVSVRSTTHGLQSARCVLDTDLEKFLQILALDAERRTQQPRSAPRAVIKEETVS